MLDEAGTAKEICLMTEEGIRQRKKILHTTKKNKDKTRRVKESVG